jgi:hypothetical protein
MCCRTPMRRGGSSGENEGTCMLYVSALLYVILYIYTYMHTYCAACVYNMCQPVHTLHQIYRYDGTRAAHVYYMH